MGNHILSASRSTFMS